MHGMLHTAVRIHLDLAVLSPSEADRQTELQLTSACLLPNGFERSLPQQIQLELAHRSLEPEQQPVIQNARIIDPIRIDHDGAH